ncbi:MAG: TM0106 family RecB-like putative nuclease, partial [Actinobacteria bacterium]|nr:TM0106 family RecB-like putative nuclease [Actinomycetota bacterium]
MQLRGDNLLFSPSDLNDFVECEHLTVLELWRIRGDFEYTASPNPAAELVKEKGLRHEDAFLARLAAEGKTVAKIELDEERWDLERAAADTLAAMQAGVDVVYQATMLEGGWRGFADFLFRVEGASDLGSWHYEPADTKLARHVKPYFVLQLCFYAQVLAGMQGRVPERLHVVLGTGETEVLRVADFEVYYRRVRERFLAFVADPPPTYPWRVRHCDICTYDPLCTQRRSDDDHLTLVAGLRRDQARRLAENGVSTLAELATALETDRPATMQPRTWAGLRDQASLQLGHRRTDEHVTSMLEPEPSRGFALLPAPSRGDLFFDIEGDPFWAADRGLEYLWGITDTERRFHAFWAHDEEQEKRALQDFVAFVHERLAADPNLHVYHYASYETARLKSLMGRYGVCEDEIDDLLRREVFVDLYKVVRQALRTSHPNLSLKSVEKFYTERQVELQSGGDSILMYEEWRETGDQRLLDEIRDYNEEDCASTLDLRDWLLGLRADAEREHGPIPWFGGKEPEEPQESAAETAELRARLEADGVPEHALLARLLDYHRREAKPVWWQFFARRGATPEGLAERDSEAIGMLEVVSHAGEEGELVTFAFPAQQHKLSADKDVFDPLELTRAGKIEALDDERGRLVLKLSGAARERPLPLSLIPGGPLQTKAQRAALRRLGESPSAYPALTALLRRDPPRGPAALPPDDLDAAKRIVEELDRSYLVVQGPPGSGKTYTGARLIVHLLSLGRRVGISATSHKAIENLLREVERVAVTERVEFTGWKKGGGAWEGRFVTKADFKAPEEGVLLVAGTAWLFAGEEMDGVLDTLFIDEAGQVSLADALALGTSARNLVLLGDPQQLAQVAQGTHPEGAGVSVLEHVLGDELTIPPDRGLFLGITWRMHEDVCRFVSETSYEGRLHPAEPCGRQGTSFGTGLRYLAVEHEGNRASSPEEAERIALEIQRLRGGTWTDCDGIERPIRDADILVVAPYNAQVRCLRAKLPASIAVG